MTAPACPDCGAEMQNIVGKWRCPWASPARVKECMETEAPEICCHWPMVEQRDIPGLPNGVTASA